MRHELNLPGVLGSQPGQQGSLQGGFVFSGEGKLKPVCGMESSLTTLPEGLQEVGAGGARRICQPCLWSGMRVLWQSPAKAQHFTGPQQLCIVDPPTKIIHRAGRARSNSWEDRDNGISYLPRFSRCLH